MLYNTLDYFGGLLYPVSDDGSATHLHMFAAIEGGTTVNRTEFSTALGDNWPGKSDTTHQSQGTQPLSTPTSFITEDSRGPKVFANEVTDINNPYVSDRDYSLANYNYSGVYNKKEVNGELDFNSVDLGNDINGILQPVVQESMANVVSYFGVDPNDAATYGKLKIRGFVSNSITFEYTDDDCISMEINNSNFISEEESSNDDGDWVYNGNNLYNGNSGKVQIGGGSNFNTDYDDYKLSVITSHSHTPFMGSPTNIIKGFGIKNSSTSMGSGSYDTYFDFTNLASTLTVTNNYAFAINVAGTNKLLIESNKFTIGEATKITDLAGSGTRMVVADSQGNLSTQTIPEGSSEEGADDQDWIRVTPTGGLTNGGLVPQNSTDVVGIGPGATSASKNYGLYVNGSTNLRAAALYTSIAGPSVYVQNSNTTTSGDGIHIALFGPGGTTRDSSLLDRNLSAGSANNRFLDFSWNGVESGFLAIRRKGNVSANQSNESIGLQNRSDGEQTNTNRIYVR